MKLHQLDQLPGALPGTSPLRDSLRWLRTCLGWRDTVVSWNPTQHEAASQSLAAAENMMQMDVLTLAGGREVPRVPAASWPMEAQPDGTVTAVDPEDFGVRRAAGEAFNNTVPKVDLSRRAAWERAFAKGALWALALPVMRGFKPYRAPADFYSHRDPWRSAITRCMENAEPANIDSDDAGYWRHELRAFDRAYDALTNGSPEPTHAFMVPVNGIEVDWDSIQPWTEAPPWGLEAPWTWQRVELAGGGALHARKVSIAAEAAREAESDVGSGGTGHSTVGGDQHIGPATSAPEPIPQGVYYRAEFDNFYCMRDNHGMGNDFFVKWADRRHEFPTEAGSIEPSE